MRYHSGAYALNLHDRDSISGDWHPYYDPTVLESCDSPFGDWGIVARGGEMVASHARACLDLLLAGKFSNLDGMRDILVNDDSLTGEIFELVLRLATSPRWQGIERCMRREYKADWVRYLKSKGLEGLICV